VPIYFDNNASTHLDPAVLEDMLPYLSGPATNPSSLHRYGRLARDAVERARAQVAAWLGCQSKEVIWTSGGTEANNLAIKGVLGLWSGGSLLYGATDHPAVMETAEAQRRGDWRVEPIAMDRRGEVIPEAFKAQLQWPDLRLVTLMRANNETGVIQDLPAWREAIRATRAVWHVDAVQAAGKMPLDFNELGADLMSVSSHKIHGPKGVGALIIRAGTELAPLLHGGGQEEGLRGGTENVAGIVGFGAAAERAGQALAQRMAVTAELKSRLEAGLRQLRGVTLFGDGAPRLSNTVQFSLPGWEGEALSMQLDRQGIAVSSGSACASGTGEPSHVLMAMGWDREIAYGAIRVSLGSRNTAQEVDQFLAVVAGLQRPG